MTYSTSLLNMYVIGISKLPEHNEVLHKDNFQKVFQWFHQFGMLYHLLQRQPIILKKQ